MPSLIRMTKAAVSLDNDAACLKLIAPIHASINKVCSELPVERKNKLQNDKRRLVRNVHQPIFNGQTGPARQQVGIITALRNVPQILLHSSSMEFLHAC